MYHYSMSDQQVMDMPVTRFWLVVRMLNKILAENEMSSFRVATSPNMDKKGMEKYIASLKEQIGGTSIVAIDEEPDREGIELLKRMSNKSIYQK